MVSPWLEKRIKEIYASQQVDPGAHPIRLHRAINSPARTDFMLDGDGSEEKFYWDHLRPILGEGFHRYVAPQVMHASILEDSAEATNTRIDFLLTLADQCVAIEIDDDSHPQHQGRDSDRDQSLARIGIETIRIPNHQIETKHGPELDQVRLLARQYASQLQSAAYLKTVDLVSLAIKFSYQVQAALLEALDLGLVDDLHAKVAVNFNTTLIDRKSQRLLLNAIAQDMRTQFDMACRLSSMEPFDILRNLELVVYERDFNGLLITFQTDQESRMSQMVIQDMVMPYVFIDPCPVYHMETAFSPDETVLNYFLQLVFRKPYLLEGQLETITRILENKDTIVLLPTGAGKSIAFQLASILLPGVTLVVDPIIALIHDQMDNLQRMGIDRVGGITSDNRDRQDKKKILSLLGQGEYLMFYVSPERFQMSDFREAVKETSVSRPIPLVAIDEAHCVSEWGHDFRTAYLNLGRTIREYCLNGARPACIAALTGTASSAVLHDVQRELQITTYDAIVTPKTFDRKELHFEVISAKSSEKANVLAGILNSKLPSQYRTTSASFFQPRQEQTNCGIVFCPHKRGDYGIMSVAQNIGKRASIRAEVYSGSAPKSVNEDLWRETKTRNAKGFKNNDFSVLVATNAFGMGIDKPNIRFTVHYGLPQSPEAFYQEAGRAGRDRGNSYCYLILSNDFIERNRKLLDFKTTPEKIKAVIDAQARDQTDDIDRALYFHTNAFRGLNSEEKLVDQICSQLEPVPRQKKVNISFGTYGDNEKDNLEKTIHRFVILGVIRDYTVNYGSREIVAEFSTLEHAAIIERYASYVRGYNRGRVGREMEKLLQFQSLPYPAFAAKAFQVLLTFIYDTIEKGRRRALSEMLAIATQAGQAVNADKVIRTRIVEYFETHHSEELDEILASPNGGFDKVRDILIGVESSDGQLIGEVRSPMEASQLRGEVSRSLESTPDHPGLLILRALTEIMASDADADVVTQNIRAAYTSSLDRYDVNETRLFDMLSFSANIISDKRPDFYGSIIANMLDMVGNDDFALYLISMAETDEMLLEPMQYLMNQHAAAVNSLYDQ